MPEARFSIALIADTHTRPEEGDESSPWEVNRLANARARYVVARVNQMRPAFAIHLGDIVHPVPSLPSFAGAAAAATEIMQGLSCPFHYIPGNHDIGDKPFPANPAGRVNDAALESYRHHFGQPFSRVDHDECSFILINSPVLNSGLEEEGQQRRWLEAQLGDARGRRIFLISHYPPYVCEPDEPSNYDNLDEPARSWLLDLLAEHDVEALFAGHVHNFFYHRHGNTDCYWLPATSFFRQDYAELFPVEAADQHGRNDAGKLGFFTLDIHDRGHIARVWRTAGRTLERGEALPSPLARVAALHPRERARAPLGVHLRHPWSEVTTLPYNGPMDEFHRKRARNDHTLLALWELGVRKLRVPMSDLLDDGIRARMAALDEAGHEFTVFCFQIPDDASVDAMVRHAGVVSAFEFIIPWTDRERVLPALARLRQRCARPVLLSKMESSADKKAQGSRFAHFVSYGFTPDEQDLVEAFLALDGAREAVDGLVFRVGLSENLWAASATLDALMSRHALRGVVNVRLASDNPAQYMDDDAAIALRVAQALCAAHCATSVELFLDTFVDLDRGYFPRHGLFDRRLNPRLASHVYRNLQGVLGSLATPPARVEGSSIHMQAGSAQMLLLAGSDAMPADWCGADRPCTVTSLVDGTVSETGDLDAPPGDAGPRLLRIE